jgi:hypothetical protein
MLSARETFIRRRHDEEWTGCVRNATPPAGPAACFEASEILVLRETARSRVSLCRLEESGLRGAKPPPVAVPHLLLVEAHVIVHHHADFAVPTLPADRLAALGLLEAGVTSRALSTALQIDHGARILLRLTPNVRLRALPLRIVFQRADPRSGRRCVVWAFVPPHTVVNADRLLDFHALSGRTPREIRRALIQTFVEEINPTLGGVYLINPWSWSSGVEHRSDRARLQSLLHLFAAADPELQASLPIDLEVTLPAHPRLGTAYCARQSIIAHGAPLSCHARDRLVFLVNLAAEGGKSWGARLSIDDDPMPFLRTTRRKAPRDRRLARRAEHLEAAAGSDETVGLRGVLVAALGALAEAHSLLRHADPVGGVVAAALLGIDRAKADGKEDRKEHGFLPGGTNTRSSQQRL